MEPMIHYSDYYENEHAKNMFLFKAWLCYLGLEPSEIDEHLGCEIINLKNLDLNKCSENEESNDLEIK